MRSYLRFVMAKRDKYTAPRNPQVRSGEDDVPTAQDRLKGIESWYETNKKLLNSVLLGILVVVGGYFAYNKFLKAPKNRKASESIYTAQQLFAKDSMNLAAKGEGHYYGAEKVIEKYGGTDAGNLARFYAGRAALASGDFQKAITHFKEFDGAGTLPATVANGCIGDAYMELGKAEDAISYYKKATSDKNDVFLTPLYLERLGIVYLNKGQKEKAVEVFNRIKMEYGSSAQGRNAEKYLALLGDYSA